jgi:hypothetical protein
VPLKTDWYAIFENRDLKPGEFSIFFFNFLKPFLGPVLKIRQVLDPVLTHDNWNLPSKASTPPPRPTLVASDRTIFIQNQTHSKMKRFVCEAILVIAYEIPFNSSLHNASMQARLWRLLPRPRCLHTLASSFSLPSHGLLNSRPALSHDAPLLSGEFFFSFLFFSISTAYCVLFAELGPEILGS